MAQQIVDPNFGTLVIPQAIAGYTVAAANAGVAASGILMLVGEADAGPDYTLETAGVAGGPIDLSANVFGPDQLADVIAKYKSGPIVDAMRAFVAPSSDPAIAGAPSAFVIAKTNPSGQATGALLNFSASTYATLGALQRGQGGNNTYWNVATPGSASTVQALAESVPSVKFTALVSAGTINGALRVDGGAAETFSWDGHVTVVTPATIATDLALTGVSVQGGTATNMLSGAGVSVALLASGNALTLTLSASTFSIQANVGDTLYIPAGGTIASAVGNSSLAGSYVVTAANAAKTSITAQKLLDATAGTPLHFTALSVGTTPVTSVGAGDVIDYSQITVSNAASGTTIASGSNAAVLPQASISVASTTGFPSSGTFTVQTSAGAQVVTYTGTSGGNTFTGCTGGTGTLATGNVVSNPIAGIGRSLEVADAVSGAPTDALLALFQSATSIATAIASGSNAAVLPQASINVGSTTGFPTSGTVLVATSTGMQAVKYTGVTATTFTGCSGGTGTMSTGGVVVYPGSINWVSVAAAPKLVTSAQEYVAELDVNNQVTNVQEALVAGGELGLLLGFTGATAQVVNNGTTLTFTLSSGTLGPLTLSNFPTIGALAAYLNAQPNFSAAAGSGITAQLPTSALDQGTFTFASSWGVQALRWKVDAYRFANRAVAQSALVQLVAPLPTAGLPEPQAATFLSGGSRGGSTDANITGAMDALQNVVGNFLVPLFSQNASLDIAAGTTDPSSTYDIASINAYAKTHVLLMSQPKRKRARQALLSIRDTFANAQSAASGIATFRCCMTFQDVKNVGASGALTQFQPWMGAGLAAAMQAAGFYKGIVQKLVNCSGIVQAAGDYNDQNASQEQTALQAGLLPLKRDLTGGGIYFLSDQTTYGTDSNFVYNSLQAVYVADVMAMTLAQRMQRAFVGQSVADISASMAVAYVKNILADFLALKLVAPSDGAPKGYKPGSILVKISGTSMTVRLTVFLAGLLYFVPIEFQINQVQQSASA